ncbi:MAG: hypothetical protein ACLKAK_06995 [Alkaliphilus sp.]
MYIEWIGYVASVLVAVSLLMSSIVKLRWYNLVGSGLFAIYGFYIGALPITAINAFIFCINIYYLIKIYTAKEYFEVVEIGKKDMYLKHFINYYYTDIRTIFPTFSGDIEKTDTGFYILRNLIPAGIFITSKHDDETLIIDVDYAKPEYQDLKTSKYIFETQRALFLARGYKRFIAHASNKRHISYLKKMGFTEMQVDNKTLLEKNI